MMAAQVISADAWLGEMMGKPAFRVSPGAGTAAVSNDVLEALDSHNQSGSFYYAKLPTSEVRLAHQFTQRGFFVVDAAVTLEVNRVSQLEANRTPPRSISVTESQLSDEEAIVDVAARSFRFTRFHLDPFVSQGVADRIKGEWVRNYVLKKRGDALFIARDNGAPVGFLASLVTGPNDARVAVLDLIGVAPSHQKMHIGPALVNAFIERYRANCKQLIVGTQVANIPSVRLYERMGFSLLKTEYVLHRHT